MNMYKYRTAILLLLLAFSACETNDDCDCSICDQQVVVSEDEYQNAPDDHLVIDSVKITGDCLKIYFSSGGCSGDTWQLKLIDSEAVLESNPVQRNIRLSLKNEEPCDAWFSRDISFDISALQVGDGPVLLNLTNSDHQILYEY